LYLEAFRGEQEGKFLDIWDRMIEMSGPEYSPSEWQKCIPLFDTSIERVIQKMNVITSLHAEVFSVGFKTLLLRTRRRLETERQVYLSLPVIVEIAGNNPVFFSFRFQEVSRILSQLAREADRIREEIVLNQEWHLFVLCL
jgi:hypothetical protein